MWSGSSAGGAAAVRKGKEAMMKRESDLAAGFREGDRRESSL